MKNRGSLAGLVLAICLTVAGCKFLLSSSISERSGSGQTVAGVESSFGVLHLTVPQDLTTFTNMDLVRQCPSGRLTNVTTELKFREWFLFQYYKVSASRCLAESGDLPRVRTPGSSRAGFRWRTLYPRKPKPLSQTRALPERRPVFARRLTRRTPQPGDQMPCDV